MTEVNRSLWGRLWGLGEGCGAMSLPRFRGRVSSWASSKESADAGVMVHGARLRSKAVRSAFARCLSSSPLGGRIEEGVSTPQRWCRRRSGFLFEGDGGEVAECRVSTLGVVEAFDEVEHRPFGFGPVDETSAIEQLTFEGGEEALAHGVVVAVT